MRAVEDLDRAAETVQGLIGSYSEGSLRLEDRAAAYHAMMKAIGVDPDDGLLVEDEDALSTDDVEAIEDMITGAQEELDSVLGPLGLYAGANEGDNAALGIWPEAIDKADIERGTIPKGTAGSLVTFRDEHGCEMAAMVLWRTDR